MTKLLYIIQIIGMIMAESEPKNKDMQDHLDYIEKKIEHFRIKANRNKIESLSCFIGILICSLSAPLFISLSDEKLWSKIVPSILSVLAAGLTSWLQLRKPQKLWSLYRNSQRLIENELIKFQFLTDDYNSDSSPKNLLIARVSNIVLAAHNEWVTTVPSPESFPATFSKGGE